MCIISSQKLFSINLSLRASVKGKFYLNCYLLSFLSSHYGQMFTFWLDTYNLPNVLYNLR